MVTKDVALTPKDEIDPTVQAEYEQLVKKLGHYMHDPEALTAVHRAFLYAYDKHRHQKRQSGELYITHPVAVAIILTELRVDAASIIAALLHDVIEDTDTSKDEIASHFGNDVAELVDGLTKIGKIKFRSNKERMAENFRKMVLAMAKDLRVIMVKLADRLHNMRTLDCLPDNKRERIAEETLDIYAPLATRLGIYGLKSELEDLCLRETKREIYQELKRKVAAKRTERQAYIDEVKSILETELKKYGFENVKVSGRPKHFYSIYKKMVDRQLAFEDIHDLFAFRITVNSIKDCYEALGIVHAMWKPMPGRFKDYIAMPKANFYQSLHTTVIRPNGEPAEIQIRTKDMHWVCEYGIAAHWAYKEKSEPKSGHKTDLKNFAWLRQIMEWQSELQDPDEFLEAVKVDLFDEEIFVFTPKGDVIRLPAGSTPLDFAFAVHTNVGIKTVGAKVDGKITPLRSKLASGSIVEITTSHKQKPTKDWLSYVRTTKARNKIRSHLRQEQREDSLRIGRELFAQALSHRGLEFEAFVQSKDAHHLVHTAREASLDDVMMSIGYGRTNPKELLEKAFPRLPHEKHHVQPELPMPTEIHKDRDPRKIKSGILVSGMENVMVAFARCCSPLPGEAIFGFITRGRGVTIHRANCPRALDLDPVRRVDVSWSSKELESGLHAAYLKVVTQDKKGVLASVTAAISDCGANIQKAQINVSPNLMGVLDFVISLRNLEQLNNVIRKIEGIPDVIFVERSGVHTGAKAQKTEKSSSKGTTKKDEN